MLRVMAGVFGCVFAFLAFLVPFYGIWGLCVEHQLGVANHSGHWLLARIVYVVFLLAFGLFCALVTFALWRYMYSGRQKAKLPPNHRTSLPQSS